VADPLQQVGRGLAEQHDVNDAGAPSRSSSPPAMSSTTQAGNEFVKGIGSGSSSARPETIISPAWTCRSQP
jgi:hypothetical protein